MVKKIQRLDQSLRRINASILQQIISISLILLCEFSKISVFNPKSKGNAMWGVTLIKMMQIKVIHTLLVPFILIPKVLTQEEINPPLLRSLLFPQ